MLAAFAELDGKQTNERADLLGHRMEEPLFSVFWPLVDGPTLMELHARGITPRDADPAERTTDGEIERLARIADAAASILRRARDDLDAGVQDLVSLLGSVLEGNGGEAGMVIELALASDRELAEAVVVRLDHDLVRELLAEEPGVVRQLLPPEQLLPILGIAAEADADELASGIRDLIQATSGNYRTDRPYLSTVYELVAERGQSRPGEALDIVLGSGLFLEDMLRERPGETVDILASDPERAAALIAGTSGYGRTPQGLIHAIVFEEPLLAARLVDLMGSMNPEAAREALVYFAYDSHRKAALPSLSVSPENDGAFILALAELQGDRGVAESMAEAIAAYGVLVRTGRRPLTSWRRTPPRWRRPRARKTTRRTARGFGASCGRPSRWRAGGRGTVGSGLGRGSSLRANTPLTKLTGNSWVPGNWTSFGPYSLPLKVLERNCQSGNWPSSICKLRHTLLASRNRLDGPLRIFGDFFCQRVRGVCKKWLFLLECSTS